jgi:3-oxoacyl-[acyl-carrier protein] reductase
VLVNAVAPGIVATELTRQNNTPEELATLIEQIPLGRLAQAEELAELIAFLCSERNSYITGQVLVCDGGLSIV